MSSEIIFDQIINFLFCRTPQEWLEKAQNNISLLVIDHAHCEKKAASTALSLISKYPNYNFLIEKLSCLAREELTHFEKVLKYLKKNNIIFQSLSASRYARTLHQLKSSKEPYCLMDNLLIAAIIEARSCERFISLSRFLKNDLRKFYHLLAQAEARHYETYLDFAKKIDSQIFHSRVDEFLEIEKDLILSFDSEFRLHSGIPKN